MEKLGALGQALECSICLELLNSSARVLPCQHTFCESCLIDISNSHKELRCPECRMLVTVPLKNLPTNIVLMRVLESIKKLPIASDPNTPCRENITNLDSFQYNFASCSTYSSAQSSATASLNNLDCLSSAFSSSSISNSMSNTTAEMSRQNNTNPFLTSAGSASMHQITPSASVSNNVQSASNTHTYSPIHSYCSNVSYALSPADSRSKRPICNSFDTQVTSVVSTSIPAVSNNSSKSLCSRQTPAEYTSMQSPGMVTARALYSYSRKQYWDMDFKKGDAITILQKIDNNWYHGKLNGKVAFFPASYLQIEGGVTSPQCLALYDFKMQPDRTDCLSFQKGDIINVLGRVDENWAAGKLNSNAGIFPLSFVELNDFAKSLVGETSKNLSESPNRGQESHSQLNEIKKASSTIKPGIYICIHPYLPTKPDELELQKGNYYVVTEKCKDGWFKGYCSKNKKLGVFPGNYLKSFINEFKGTTVTRPYQTKDFSIDQSSCTKKTLCNNTNDELLIDIQPNDSKLPYCQTSSQIDCDRQSVFKPTKATSKTLDNKAGADDILVDITPSESNFQNCKYIRRKSEIHSEETTNLNSPRTITPLVREKYKCIAAYPPSGPDELELKLGDIVYVHKKIENGWYKGTLQKSGESGFFPSSFVEPF